MKLKKTKKHKVLRYINITNSIIIFNLYCTIQPSKKFRKYLTSSLIIG